MPYKHPEVKQAHDSVNDHPLLLRCETCGELVETLNEADECDECHSVWADEEAARLFPLYCAERMYRQIYEELGIDPESFRESDL